MAQSVQAQNTDGAQKPSRTIAVSGSGEVQAEPDMAQINVGVTSEADSAGDAVTQNNEAMEELLRYLKTAGIAEKDVQTRQFNLSPRYQQDRRGGSSSQKIIGYQVTNQVQIRVRDLSDLGTVLDEVVRAGANDINGIQFMIANDQDLMDEARRNAIADAKRRANILSEAAGVKLGQVIEIIEGAGDPGPGPQPRMMMAAEAGVPIARGEQTLTSQVQVVFALGND